MKKTPVFLIILFFLVILIPQLCAQPVTMTPEEAAKARSTFVDYSKQFIGCPYQSGAIGPDAFDCSGLIFTCSRESIGVQLPRKTTAIFSFCEPVADSDREAGDLVFFKTTSSGEVSHVGVYIGNGQFIHAASDGPNTGVIISSLRESYWKTHYFASRRFLPATLKAASGAASAAHTEGAAVTETAAAEPASTGTASTGTARSAGKRSTGGARTAQVKKSGGSHPFLSAVVFDGSLFADWNFFTSKNVRLNFRGVSAMAHARYTGNSLQPGVGMFIRYDAGTGVFQLPLIASLSFGEYVRAYAGPVISFGTPSLPGDSSTETKASFFPGIMGICWQTPALFTGKKLALSLVQDIHYTVFNRTNGAALSAVDSIASGLVFSTGLRLMLPLKTVL